MSGVVVLNPVAMADGYGNIVNINAEGKLLVNTSDSVVNVDTAGALQSSSYPDPSSYDTGEVVPLLVDAFGNLQTRGPVFTDEISFRDDFIGDSLLTTLTGTLTFTNGSTTVIGTGTLFTEEVLISNYVKLSSHNNSAFAQISYFYDDTTLELTEPYTGATGSGVAVESNWKPLVALSSSASVDTSYLRLSNAGGDGYITQLSRAGDYLPFVLTMVASASQRVANQEIVFGFQDDPDDPAQQAVIVLSGTNDRIVLCRSSFSSDSVEETEVLLPGGLSTDDDLTYDIEVVPNAVGFLVEGNRLATHKIHLPGPYTPLSLVTKIENSGIVGSTTTLNIDSLFFQNTDQVQTGNIFKSEPQPVQGVANGVPIVVQFGLPGGVAALPKMINIVFNKSEGSILAGVYKRVLSYTVPSGFNGYLIKFVSFQGEAASSRFVAETSLCQHNLGTNTFTAGTAYAFPQWASVIQAEVTTALSSGSGNITLTVSYTNSDGTAGRSGSFSIPKGSVVGGRWDITLQSGDIGIRSIESISSSPSIAAGVVKVLGLVQLSIHRDQSTTTQTETLFAPGAITFPTGTVLGLEYAGGTVSKSRLFDALVQLVDS